MKSITLNEILTAIGITALLVLLSVAMAYGFKKSDQSRCLTLQAQAQEGYFDFYITPTEKDMCDYHNIEIDAPVKVR